MARKIPRLCLLRPRHRISYGAFIDFAFGVILKGNGAWVLAWDIAAIAILETVLFAFSLLWFQPAFESLEREDNDPRETICRPTL
jgi:hypothetical protein